MVHLELLYAQRYKELAFGWRVKSGSKQSKGQKPPISGARDRKSHYNENRE